MSAALTRANELEHSTNELTQPAEIGVPGKLEARPVTEVTSVSPSDLGSITDQGMTPLMQAACDGLAGTVQALLDRRAGLNAKRSDGFNALALAAFFGHSQVVWLLLENGADLDAVGRSKTPPERWADARGFVDIGDILREARATRQVEASNARAAVIDESARFPRPADQEELQRAGGPGPDVEVPVLDEATDSETTLVISPTTLAEESPGRKSESTADTFPNDKSGQTQERSFVKHSPRALKTLPEIEDPLPLVVPEFRPVSAFVARVTSSRKNLAALILAGWLVFTGIAVLLIPQIRKSLADGQTEAGAQNPNLPPEPSNPGAEAGAKVSGTAKPPSTVTNDSTTAPASKDIQETAHAKSVESTSRFESAEVSEKGSAGAAATRGVESRAHRWPSNSTGNRVAEPSEIKRKVSAATSVSRPITPARKQRDVWRAEKFKQQTVAEEQPKPAPLSVEASRSRSVLSTPARSADEASGSQALPLSIISGKPKSKVIQWP